jgi:hypothetical protein
MLLVDLYESPTAVEASKSRLLIDSMFISTTPKSRIARWREARNSDLAGSGAAWRLLRSLRARAWRLARLDPDCLSLPSMAGSSEPRDVQAAPWPYRDDSTDEQSISGEDDGDDYDSDDSDSNSAMESATTVHPSRTQDALRPPAPTPIAPLSRPSEKGSGGFEVEVLAPGGIIETASGTQVGEFT